MATTTVQELTAARRAMACEFSVTLPAAETRHPVDAACAALDEIERLEALLSFFQEDSAISRLNRGEPVHDTEVLRLLRSADALSRATRGAFDVRFGGGRPVNLGAIGKGYAIDQALHLLRTRFGIASAFVQGGRSSLKGIGPRPWTVDIGDPPVARVRLRNQALGTSANDRRRHILDPRTGQPADAGLVQVSSIAPTAAEADALSTAFFVLGEAATRRFIAQFPHLGAVLVRQPGNDRRGDVIILGSIADAEVL